MFDINGAGELQSEYRYRGGLYSVVCSMWSRMPHWTMLICLLLAAVTVAMAKEGDREMEEMEEEGERDILASVRDILYEDVASNEIETDGPALKR